MTFTDLLLLIIIAAGGCAVVGLVILSTELCARFFAWLLGPEWSLDSQPGQIAGSGAQAAATRVVPAEHIEKVSA